MSKPMFRVGAHVMHITSRGVYRITDSPKLTRLERTLQPCYGYREVRPHGIKYVRAQTEMEDGRFKVLDLSHPALIMALATMRGTPCADSTGEPSSNDSSVSAEIIPFQSRSPEDG
jgi:hypothetical protein